MKTIRMFGEDYFPQVGDCYIERKTNRVLMLLKYEKRHGEHRIKFLENSNPPSFPSTIEKELVFYWNDWDLIRNGCKVEMMPPRKYVKSDEKQK